MSLSVVVNVPFVPADSVTSEASKLVTGSLHWNVMVLESELDGLEGDGVMVTDGTVVSSVLSITPDAVAVNASNELPLLSSTVPVPTEYATLTSRSDGAKLLAAKVSVISVPENEPPVG